MQYNYRVILYRNCNTKSSGKGVEKKKSVPLTRLYFLRKHSQSKLLLKIYPKNVEKYKFLKRNLQTEHRGIEQLILCENEFSTSQGRFCRFPAVNLPGKHKKEEVEEQDPRYSPIMCMTRIKFFKFRNELFLYEIFTRGKKHLQK